MAETKFNNAYAPHAVNLNPPEKFDFSVEKLPESHKWNRLDDQSDFPIVHEPVPVIDITNIETDLEVRETIGKLCESWGMFQVTGHGFPSHVLENTFTEAQRLFALPMETKLRAARRPGGLPGYGEALMSQTLSKGMWSEFFFVMGSALENAKKIWPEDYQRFCDAIDEYNAEMKKLSRRLMKCMLTSLDSNAEWIGLEDSNPVLALISYPVCPDPENAIGLGAHTDTSLLSVLWHNTDGGLQVKREAHDRLPARWVPVPVVPNSLTVNIGDFLQIVTNGRFKSVIHRVAAKQKVHRYTLTYFHVPTVDVPVAPMKRFLGPTEKPMYRQIMWGELASLKIKHLEKTIDLVRIEDDG